MPRPPKIQRADFNRAYEAATDMPHLAQLLSVSIPTAYRALHKYNKPPAISKRNLNSHAARSRDAQIFNEYRGRITLKELGIRHDLSLRAVRYALERELRRRFAHVTTDSHSPTPPTPRTLVGIKIHHALGKANPQKVPPRILAIKAHVPESSVYKHLRREDEYERPLTPANDRR